MAQIVEEMITQLLGELDRLEVEGNKARLDDCLKSQEAMRKLYTEACLRAKIPNRSSNQSFPAIWGTVLSRYYENRGTKDVDSLKDDERSISPVLDRSQYSPVRELNGSLTQKVNNRIDFNRNPNSRKTIVITEDELKSSADEGTFINGWVERSQLEDHLGLSQGQLAIKSEYSYDIIKRLLLMMKKINDSKRQSSTVSTEMGSGFICDFAINGRTFKVVSNAGMLSNAASIQMAVTNNLLTPKRLMSIMAPAMMKFVVDHPPIIFRVIGVEWSRPEVKMAFKTIINLLLCLDGMNNAFDWSSEDYRNHEGQLIDPSFAYGITYYNVHGALSRQGKARHL